MSPDQFFLVKGGLSLVATVALIVHMQMTWGTVDTLGRQLRYYALLYFAILLTYASAEQIHTGALVNPRNVGALFGAALIVAAAVVSIREDRRP